MTDPQLLVLVGSGFVVINTATHIGVKIITDRLLNNGHSKVCPKHGRIETTLKQLEEAHKEETMVAMIAKALEKNGK